MKSFQFKDLMVNVAPSKEEAIFCAATCFGTCRYGTVCGFITPCGFTCDVGRTCGAYSSPHTVLQVQARAAAPAFAGGCGFGGYTCNYGTYCGFSIEPCGYTCDVGATHLTRPVFEEQARVAGPAGAQAAAGAGLGRGAGAICQVGHSICPFFTCQHTPCYTGSICPYGSCFGCTIAITETCRGGLTILPCQIGTCGVSIDPTLTVQGDPQAVASQLAAVKAQLQQELAAIEKQEKAVAEALQPQTVADVEELQAKLREAIAELDERKQELHKKAEKPSKK
jgi:hypothetical protein